MPAQPTPLELKKLLSRAVLSMPGVSGVGLPEQGLTVYLADGSADSRSRVQAAVLALKLPVAVHLEVTGPFRARVTPLT